MNFLNLWLNSFPTKIFFTETFSFTAEKAFMMLQ